MELVYAVIINQIDKRWLEELRVNSADMLPFIFDGSVNILSPLSAHVCYIVTSNATVQMIASNS